MKRHIEIKASLVKVMDDGIGTLSFHRESVKASFMKKLAKHNSYMQFIYNVSTALQKKHLPLSDCRCYLDTLVNRVNKGRNNRNSIFNYCRLGTSKITADDGLTTDPDFETGVCKIQQGVTYEVTMTMAEKSACRSLLLSPNNNDDD